MRVQFVRDVEAAIGSAGVITEPEQLRTYECDGLTGHRVVRGWSRFPRARRRFGRWFASAHATASIRRARGPDGPLRRRLARGRGVVVSLARMDRILEVDLEGARVTSSRASPTSTSRRRSLRTDSSTRRIPPASRSARSGATSPRTRGSPLPQVRLHRQPRAKRRSSSRTASSSSSAARGLTRAPTCSARSSAPRGRSASSRGDPRPRRPQAGGRPHAPGGFDSIDAAGDRRSRAMIAAGVLPRRDRDDGPAHDRGGRGRGHAGLSGGRGAVLIVELDGVVGAGRGRSSRPCSASASRAVRFEIRAAADDGDRALLWWAASRPSRRWAG